ncbi:hypothetical protein JRO89_XS13G0250800 [Xanthoceras sorbifolium]|uniref:RING-CH-type domain-containing protein n=1 Tax=Xanthoceras sorbifolium TaxID=99658 RepID=A0ABQ8H9V8_9ROSI|nr:hypothetical protein JRO89_XS13G0250800 [Xanthoceras sorbifolium]
MSDHLVLCVDRLITPGSVQSLPGSETPISSGEGSSSQAADRPACVVDVKEVGEDGVSEEEEPLIQMVECRICQEEDSINNLEVPCACSGSLKATRQPLNIWKLASDSAGFFSFCVYLYGLVDSTETEKFCLSSLLKVLFIQFAHRKCVQRWCNEKGDITCEICHKPYQPGYTAPPPPPHSEDATIDIRQVEAWTVSGAPLDLHDPRLLAMAAAERHLLEAEYDEYADTNASGAAFCRSAALILMALLLLRHALSLSNSDGDDDASTFFSLFLLRAAGFLLPCYIMAWAVSILQRRRQRQEAAALAATEVAFMLQAGQRRGLQFTIASGPAVTPHQEPLQ